jgi:hypothetical protein
VSFRLGLIALRLLNEQEASMNSGTNESPCRAPKGVALGRVIRSRSLWVGASGAMVWLFPDASLSLIGAAIHVTVGWLEIGLKTLLEVVFGLSHRTAQIVVAWGGMSALLMGLVIAARRSWRFAAACLVSLRIRVLVSMTILRLAHLRTLVLHGVLMVSGCGRALYGLV